MLSMHPSPGPRDEPGAAARSRERDGPALCRPAYPEVALISGQNEFDECLCVQQIGASLAPNPHLGQTAAQAGGHPDDVRPQLSNPGTSEYLEHRRSATLGVFRVR